MAEGLRGLRIYQLAEILGDEVWKEVISWKPFARDTLDRQFVDAADSVGGNIAERYGRYHYRENRLFQLYARGSLEETGHWLRRAHVRGLICQERYTILSKLSGELAPQLNAYIRTLETKSRKHTPKA